MIEQSIIQQDRLWNLLMEVAQFGGTPKGGVCRLALSKEDKAARDWFIEKGRALGCSIRIDPVGNIFLRRAGHDPSLPPVLTGSHLDTQPTGGKFDGAYGVMAGLEIFQALNDHGITTQAPLELVAWTNEEGPEFAPPMFGSSVYAGSLELDLALNTSNSSGTRADEALQQLGYRGDEPLQPYSVDSYFEAHIEQGPILEEAGKSIGVVTAVQGLIWYDITLTGQAAHAGAAPMDRRKDALDAATQLLHVFYELAGKRFFPHGRATAGELHLTPGSRNTVPETVTIKVDMRHPDASSLDEMDAAVNLAANDISTKTGVAISIDKVAQTPPVNFDQECVAAVALAAQKLNVETIEMVSGAGHDAAQIACIIPTAMIFIPCLNGLSHNEAESASPKDVTIGCEVLLGAMLQRSGIIPA